MSGSLGGWWFRSQQGLDEGYNITYGADAFELAGHDLYAGHVLHANGQIDGIDAIQIQVAAEIGLERHPCGVNLKRFMQFGLQTRQDGVRCEGVGIHRIHRASVSWAWVVGSLWVRDHGAFPEGGATWFPLATRTCDAITLPQCGVIRPHVEGVRSETSLDEHLPSSMCDRCRPGRHAPERAVCRYSQWRMQRCRFSQLRMGGDPLASPGRMGCGSGLHGAAVWSPSRERPSALRNTSGKVQALAVSVPRLGHGSAVGRKSALFGNEGALASAVWATSNSLVWYARPMGPG